jgi:predicted PurR-regulated permease PerM
MGKAVGLHAGVVIASVIAFGYKWGFWGVLLAIPVLALSKSFLESMFGLYKNSKWYGSE